jgi:hypothetical protein
MAGYAARIGGQPVVAVDNSDPGTLSDRGASSLTGSQFKVT